MIEDKFNLKDILEYLSKTTDGFDNTFLRCLVGNLVYYAVRNQSVSKDQLCWFLSDILPDVDFFEIAAFTDDSCLTDHGLEKKRYFWSHREGA